MRVVHFTSELADGDWLTLWKLQAMPWVIRVQIVIIYLIPVLIAGLIAPFNMQSAVSLAFLLYVVIVFKGGMSPGQKLMRYSSRNAWHRLSADAKALLLGPKILVVHSAGVHWESTLSDVFWRWRAVSQVILKEEGIILTLVTDPAQARAFIPKRAFASDADRQEFYHFCRQMMQQACEDKAGLSDETVAAAGTTQTMMAHGGASLLRAAGSGILLATFIGITFLFVGMMVIAVLLMLAVRHVAQ